MRRLLLLTTWSLDLCTYVILFVTWTSHCDHVTMDDTTHFLVELALRASVAASLREGHAAAVWGHHAEVGHSQPVTSQGGVCMSG